MLYSPVRYLHAAAHRSSSATRRQTFALTVLLLDRPFFCYEFYRRPARQPLSSAFETTNRPAFEVGVMVVSEARLWPALRAGRVGVCFRRQASERQKHHEPCDAFLLRSLSARGSGTSLRVRTSVVFPVATAKKLEEELHLLARERDAVVVAATVSPRNRGGASSSSSSARSASARAVASARSTSSCRSRASSFASAVARFARSGGSDSLTGLCPISRPAGETSPFLAT